MNTLVEVAIPVADFALKETFVSVPEARFELLPTISYRSETGPPLLRVKSDREVADVLRTDPTLASVKTIVSDASSTLFAVRWTSTPQSVFETILEDDVVISHVSATKRHWTFQLQTTTREVASRLYHRCTDRGISMEIRRLQQLDGVSGEQIDFSEEQLEVLQLAFEHGYYDTPRGITVGELADRIGVSHQAVSERIRRAHDQLIGNSIPT